MKTGKISESIWNRSVGKQLKSKREEVLMGAGMKNDCTAFCVNGGIVLSSMEPVVLPTIDAAGRAVWATLNDLAAQGAEPLGILISLLLPKQTEEKELKNYMRKIAETAEIAHVEIMDVKVHTTKTVISPVITVNAQGIAEPEKVKRLMQGAPEMDVVCTKWIGLDATVSMAYEREEELLARLPKEFVKNAQLYGNTRSVLPEAAVAAESGAATMHPAREGGIFAALWELGEKAGVGLEIDLKKIPVRQETIEVSEILDFNPYEAASLGCLLIATPDGFGLVQRLREKEIPAVVIGKTTDGNDRVLYNEDEVRYLEPTKPDELYRMLEP